MTKQRPSDKEMADLINLPNFKRTIDTTASTDPIQPTPMVLSVDEIDIYDHNPRQLPNDKYEEIKASIRAAGMDQTLTISRRPDSPNYMISAGGNTRLQIVKELWAETSDERFRTVHCLFRPWAGDTDTLVSHLKENDVRGDLVFIDRARALTQLKAMVEEERGKELSLREYSAHLANQGYSVGRTVLNSVQYATRSLAGAIPIALSAGLGRKQVEQIRKLHNAFIAAWDALQIPDVEGGEPLFLDLLGRHDDELIDLDLLQRDAVNELSVSADCDVQYAAMLYGAVLEGREVDHLIEQINANALQEDSPDGEAPAVDIGTPPPSFGDQSSSTENAQDAVVTPDASAPVATETASPSRGNPNDHRPSDRPMDVASLRVEAYRLAHVAAGMLGCGEMIAPIDNGLGFLVNSVPDAAREALPVDRRPVLLCTWWMLVTVSEQFATHGGSATSVPPPWIDTPVGNAIAESGHFDQWQARMFQENNVDALCAVPFMPVSNYAALGLHQVAQGFFDTWLTLVATTRRIYEVTHGQPWT